MFFIGLVTDRALTGVHHVCLLSVRVLLDAAIVVYRNHNTNHNSNTIHIQIQADSVVAIWTVYLIPDFSPWRHEERDTILTILTPLQCTAHLVIFKITVGRDLKTVKIQLPLQWSRTQLSPKWSNSNWPFSKSSNSQDHLFQAWRQPPSSPISCLEVSYDKWWLSYPLRASVNCTNWLCTWTETRMIQSPTKLNDKV